jgi:hypothetical protein
MIDVFETEYVRLNKRKEERWNPRNCWSYMIQTQKRTIFIITFVFYNE